MRDVVRCPVCGDEFRQGTERCPDCLAPLVAAGGDAGTEAGATTQDGPPDMAAPDSEAPATLDLHPLSDPERRMVDQLLTARLVRHSWQGGTLLVPARLAGEAELAVEQALAAADQGSADGDGPTVVYEVAAWPVAVHGRLAQLLGEAGIAHHWDPNGDLVVAERDEEAVEALFDQIDEGELEAAPDPLPVLDALHDHLTRLSREPLDAKARAGLTESAVELRSASLPFGFDPPVWRALVTAATALADEAPRLDAGRVRERANTLRRELRSWL